MILKKDFHWDFTTISIKRSDQMDMRLSQVFSHLHCSNISPKRSVHFGYLGFPLLSSYQNKGEPNKY